MAAKTAAEMRDLCTEAIEGILLRGQSYTIENRTFDRANLDELRTLENHYTAKALRESGSVTGVRVQRGVPVDL